MKECWEKHKASFKKAAVFILVIFGASYIYMSIANK